MNDGRVSPTNGTDISSNIKIIIINIHFEKEEKRRRKQINNPMCRRRTLTHRKLCPAICGISNEQPIFARPATDHWDPKCAGYDWSGLCVCACGKNRITLLRSEAIAALSSNTGLSMTLHLFPRSKTSRGTMKIKFIEAGNRSIVPVPMRLPTSTVRVALYPKTTDRRQRRRHIK